MADVDTSTTPTPRSRNSRIPEGWRSVRLGVVEMGFPTTRKLMDLVGKRAQAAFHETYGKLPETAKITKASGKGTNAQAIYPPDFWPSLEQLIQATAAELEVEKGSGKDADAERRWDRRPTSLKEAIRYSREAVAAKDPRVSLTTLHLLIAAAEEVERAGVLATVPAADIEGGLPAARLPIWDQTDASGNEREGSASIGSGVALLGDRILAERFTVQVTTLEWIARCLVRSPRRVSAPEAALIEDRIMALGRNLGQLLQDTIAYWRKSQGGTE